MIQTQANIWLTDTAKPKYTQIDILQPVKDIYTCLLQEGQNIFYTGIHEKRGVSLKVRYVRYTYCVGNRPTWSQSEGKTCRESVGKTCCHSEFKI